MFPASFTMFPLATIPALHSTLLDVEMEAALAALVVAITVLGTLLVHGALRTRSLRASTHRIVLRHRAL